MSKIDHDREQGQGRMRLRLALAVAGGVASGAARAFLTWLLEHSSWRL